MAFEGTNLVRLSSVVDLKTGFPFKSKEYVTEGGGARLLRGDNVIQGKLRWDDARYWPEVLSNGLNEYALEEGDVVLAMDRPWIEAGLKYARLTKQDLPSFLVQRVARLRAKRSLNQRFLFYVIGSKQFTRHVLAVQTGTSVPHISARQIGAFEFNLPPIREQEKIAQALASLDDRIELGRRISATLHYMAQVLFKSWFIDFDPVKAKTTGNTPDGLDSETAELFPSQFENSETGPIPKGWHLGTFRDCCKRVESGGTPSRNNLDYWHNGTIPWLTSAEVRHPIITSTKEHISREGLENSNAKLWPSGTIVVAMYGATAGEVSLLAGEFAANQACCGLIPKELFRTFLFIKALLSKRELANKSSGSAQQNLNQSLVAGFEAIIPPGQVVEAYDRIASVYIDKWISNERESRTLSELRDILLPKLISGQIRVKDIEQGDVR